MSAFNAAARAARRERIERVLDADELVERSAPSWLKDYSLRRALETMSTGGRSGLEFEISADLTRKRPLSHGGIVVPWEVFATRADVVGTTAVGGYLVATSNIPAADALRPNMVVGALGATILEAVDNINLPKLSGTATASWLSSETTQVSETNQTFGQLGFSPHTVSAYSEYSRLLMLQSAPSTVEFVVRRDLMALLGRALDFAALFGSGAAGQPKGLATMTGVQTFSGTTLSLAGIVDAAVALGDALNDSAGIAANRTTAGVLKKRQETTNSTRLLWEGNLVAGTSAGFPARSSTALSSGALFLGSWNYLNVVTWGGGVEVLTNPFDQGNFKAGIIGVRAMLTADVAPTWPAAFNYASTVT